MDFLLVVIAVILVVLNLSLMARLDHIRRTLISASDLNLEAHQRLLAHFQQIEMERTRDA